MKKLFSLLLVIVLMLSYVVPANAASILDLIAKYSPYLPYTHIPSGTTLSVPFDWDVDDSDSSMILFTASDDSPLMILQAVNLGDEDATLSKADQAKAIGTKSGSLKTETLGGHKYYTAQTKKTKTVAQKKVTVTTQNWILVEEGWVYVYRFTGSKKHELYDDFTTLIASASYGGAASSAGVTGTYSLLGGSYSGDTVDGKPQGEGVLSWGSSSYEGHFENGYPSGTGTFYFNDCSCKTGSSWSWTSGSYMTWLPERQGADMYYTGMTLDGSAWGYGSLDFCSGGTFLGEFQYGDPQGQGVYTYYYPSSDKAKTKSGDDWITVYCDKRLQNEYYGLKLDGKWQGFGIGVLKSGYAYCGEIKNDYRDGYGELYTKKDKLERHGLYKKGEYSKKVAQPD